MSERTEQLKNKMKTEREKLSHMSNKDKRWYIWEYYKFPIIAFLTAVFLIVSIGHSLYDNRFDTALHIIVINNHNNDEEKQTRVMEDLKDYLGLTDVRELVLETSVYLSENGSSQMDYSTVMKMTALMSAKDLDIMIAEPEIMDYYAAGDALADLSQTLSPQLYEAVKDRIYFVTSKDGKKIPAAISLKDTKFTADMNLSLEEPYLTLISNSTRNDYNIALVRYIFGQ